MMLRTFSLPLIGLGLLALSAQTVAATSAATTYSVQSGDTLSSIAQRFYGDSGQWRAILSANPMVRNPRALSVDQVLNIPARSSLSARRTRRRVGGVELVKMSPEVVATPLAAEVFSIPRDAIAPFITRPRIFDRNTAYTSPYVIGQSGGRLAAGAGDTIFVEGLFDARIGRYGVFREGHAYYNIEPGQVAVYGPMGTVGSQGIVSDAIREDVLAYQGYREGLAYLPYDDGEAAYQGGYGGELLGYEGVLVGIAEVRNFVDDGISTLKLTETYQEVLNGDVILPLNDGVFNLDIVPKAPSGQVLGTIIKIPLDTTQAGQFDLVYLNLGVQDGMQQGDVLDVYQIAHDSYDPQTRRNVSLPPERVGVVMVLRTFERISFAIVLEATRAIHIADQVESWDPS